MGKPTGFLEYDRLGGEAQSPAVRIGHFRDFHLPRGDARLREQAARCMECGVPYCQSGMSLEGMTSGCPLHNLIPEWNDLAYTGNMSLAAERLLKTSSFPEFTARVCPALCEKACTCSLNGQAVSVRENELEIIEYAFKNGLMLPKPPAARTGKTVAVIGSGPAGLACADRLNKRGHGVTVYEKSDRIGGLLMYGIPNMKIEKSVVDRRRELMRAEGVEFITGAAVGADIAPEELLSRFDAVVLACGAGTPRDLRVEGRDAEGVYFAVDYLTSVTKSLLDSGFESTGNISAEGRDVVIVGGGDTGNDCVATCIRQGCRSVVQLEMMPCPPESRAEDNPWPEWPRVLKTDYGQQEAIDVFGSDPRMYQTTVTALEKDEKGELSAVTVVSLKSERADGRIKMTEIRGSEKTLPCQMLIIAAGFLGCDAGLAGAFGVETDGRANVKTAPGGFSTNISKVFAAGDMRTGQSLVVKAIDDGRRCARETDEFLMGYTGLI